MNLTFQQREFYGREFLKELKELYPNYFKYDIHFTIDSYASYDAFYHIIDAETHSIKKRVLIEIKIRDQKFDDYLLEEKKLNSLLKIRKDLGMNENEMTLLYINFCPDETLIWNIDDVKDKNKSSLKANKATSVDRKNKVDKSVILLNKVDGKSLNYVYDYNRIDMKYKVNKVIDTKIKEIKNDLFITLFGK